MKILLLIITLFTAFSSWNQIIYHPTKAKSVVRIASGQTYHYYDSGGPADDYLSGSNSLITIYPAKEGEYVSITCNTVNLSSDTRMYIFDGNHPGSAILGYHNGRSGINGRTFTASKENKSGAISIRFTSLGVYGSKAGWDFTVTSSKSPGRAPIVASSDCSGAIKVCSDSAITTQASGKGVQELPGPGFWNRTLNYGGNGENQSNWYKFEVKTAGKIEFLITPNTHTDFDWSLWGPYNAHECPAWTTDRNYRASACDAQYNEGLTGLSSQAKDFIESSSGDCYVAALDVRAGQHYVIMIDDWSGQNTTFKLTWKFLNGASLECKKDEEPSSEPTEEMDTTLIDVIPEEVFEPQLDETVLAAGGNPADAITPKMELAISPDQKTLTIQYPGTFEWKLENNQKKSLKNGKGTDSHKVNIADLPPGKYQVSLIFSEIIPRKTFVKK